MNACKILGGKPEGNTSHGKLRSRWKDNIKMYLKEIECECSNWVQVAQNSIQWRSFVNTVIKLRVLQKAGNLLNSE
jgi:hypothetical protein